MTSTLELIFIATIAALMRAWIIGVLTMLFLAVSGLVPFAAVWTAVSTIEFVLLPIIVGVWTDIIVRAGIHLADATRRLLLKARGFAEVAVATYKEVRS